MNDEIITKLENADIQKATSSIRAYMELKKTCADAILFYRVGDFYETFFDDAILFSKNCNITFTSRKYGALGRVALAGIPQKAFCIYVKKLLDLNFKIARAEQFCDEKGNYYRKIVRVYSSATVYESEFLQADKNSYLAAIYKDGPKYGFSYADVSQGGFYLTCGTKEEIKFEITKLSPSELLLNSQELLFEFRELIKDRKNTLICPDYFSGCKFDIKKGEFALGYRAANAVLEYVLENQKDFAPKLDEIKKYSVSNFMSMDYETRRSLELIRMQADFKKQGSLFWFLDNTKTPMGRRLLREWMSAPLNNSEMILKRQAVIQKLCSKKSLRTEIESFLDSFCDMLRYSAKISNKTITYKELVEISKVLFRAKKLEGILGEFEKGFFKTDSESIELLYDFSQIIQKTFDENINEDSCELYPIKEGVCDRLDFLRFELKEVHENFKLLEKKQQETVHKNAKIKFLPNIGYYYEVPQSAAQNIDNDFIIKQKLSSTIRYADNELIEYEEKINSLKYSILQLEKDIFDKLLTYCCELTPKIREFARLCAYFDVTNSLANCIVENSFAQVKYNNDGAFELIEAMHPCVYKLKENYVKNDTQIFAKNILTILTGANMSGKSTYLKQNAIAVILSQMCGYTCAKSANMPIFDRIFFHGVVFDNLRDGESTFFAEMKKIAYILNNSTKDTLVIFDEPVKGTNKEESEALICAILEYIKQNICSKTIIATHFVNIAKHFLNDKFSKLIFVDFETKIIKQGIAPHSSAFCVAHQAGLAESIIENAKRYSLGQL